MTPPIIPGKTPANVIGPKRVSTGSMGTGPFITIIGTTMKPAANPIAKYPQSPPVPSANDAKYHPKIAPTIAASKIYASRPAATLISAAIIAAIVQIIIL
ncbi:MAG: hypothetical protein E3J21_04610 [Anaerolineales bacterium]|nr:MAG: hypothetical protein E3J21_04610 [Anaerolineales bacterium]